MNQPIVLAGPRTGARTNAMIDATWRLGYSTPVIVDYSTILQGHDVWLPEDAWVRMESPDDDREALIACYEAGADASANMKRKTATGKELRTLIDTPGWIGNPTQLAFGIVAAAKRLKIITDSCSANLSLDPDSLTLAYDKTACQRTVKQIASVADALPSPGSFESLIALMKESGHHRVYIKPQHGAGGCGTLALALGPNDKMVGYTAVETVGSDEIRQTKTVRRLTDRQELTRVVNALVPYGLHAESWLPKTSVDGAVCDVRVVMIGGQSPKAIVRRGLHTMTNLHLDAERSGPEGLRQLMGETAWARLEQTAKAVFALFSGMHMVGLDIAVLRGRKRHAVIEVNAFGDHIRHMKFDGHTLQELEVIEAMKDRSHVAA